MDKTDFMDFVRLMRSTFPTRQFLPTSEQMDVWWEYMAPLRKDYFDIAVKDYIRTQTFPPMIADITSRYHEVEERQKARMRDLREIFDFCHSCYPTNLWGENDWLRFKEKISSAKYQDALLKAEMIKRHILNDRITGDKPFADYIWEVEV